MATVDPAKLRALPPAVHKALYGIDALVRTEAIEEEFDVSLAEPIAALAVGVLRWQDCAAEIARQGVSLQVAHQVCKRIADDVLATVLPMIDPAAEQPQKRPYAEVLANARAAAGDSLHDARSSQRFDDAVESFLRNARTPEQAQQVLVRSVKIGGVGLAKDVAERVLAVLEPHRGLVAFDDAPPQQEPVGSVDSVAGDALIPNAEEVRSLDRRPGNVANTAKVDAAVERVVRMTGARFGKEETAKRFRAALASRFRDVRDAEETRAVLLRPYTEGGMGLPAETVQKLSVVIERVAGEVLGRPVVRPLPTPPNLPSRREGREQTAAPHAPVPTSPVVPPPAPRAESHIVVPPPPPPKPIPLPAVVQPVPPPRVESQISNLKSQITPASTPTPPPPPPPKPAPAPVVPQPKPPPRPVAPPAPTVGELKLAATPATPPPLRPPSAVSRADNSQLATRNSKLIQDIRPPRPRLVGPIEELEQLTIDDFRKIAKSPADAAAKIAEKLSLLDRRSHTDRAQGVRVLRGSPLMMAYADILNTALAGGKKVEEVIASAGTLTKEEFDAVMGLTEQLRV